MKKQLSILLAGAMLATTLAACGGSSSSSSAAAGGTSTATSTTGAATTGQNLVVQVGPNPETMDPALNTTTDVSTMNVQLFETLYTYDKDEVLVPGQAVAMPEISDDGLVYTFTLRDGLKWSDGTPLTAADFEYSWKRVVDPATAAPYSELVNVIAGYDEAVAGDLDALQVKAIDDTTLEVTLNAPCLFFPSMLAHGIFAPVQKATVEANGLAWSTKADTFISNGPFKMTEFVGSQYVLCEKNENYWDAENVTLDSLKFLLIEDSNAALNAYQTDIAQLIKSVPADEIPTLKTTEDFRLDPLQSISYITYNLENKALQDVNVRKALNLAIDREYIANTTMNGLVLPATSYVPPGTPDATAGSSFEEVGIEMNGGETLLSITPDVETAKALMEEAGYSASNPLRLSYSTNRAGFNIPVAEALQQMWKEIYVDLTINEVEWASFTPMRRSGDFEIARGGWVSDYPDPTSTLDLFISDNGNNYGRYNNPEYDALMAQAATELDAAKRMEILHQAEELFIADEGAGATVFSAEYYLQKPNVEGVYHTTLGNWYFKNAVIK